jgi:hypothetical protein
MPHQGLLTPVGYVYMAGIVELHNKRTASSHDDNVQSTRNDAMLRSRKLQVQVASCH